MPPSDSDGLKLTQELKGLIDGALDNGSPMVLAVVNEKGQPRLSFRGSVQVYSDDQVGLWVRNTGGETLGAIRNNPNVALIYRSATAPMIQFAGRARIADDPAERERVFESAPLRERSSDPDRKGVAVVIDLDTVEGVLRMSPEGPAFVKMART